MFFQIGDGAIVYQAEDGRYVPALWPQSGEYANCTWFLTDPDASSRVQAARARSVHEVALLTDGLQGLALQFVTRAAHGPFFEPMFARLRSGARSPAARPRGRAQQPSSTRRPSTSGRTTTRRSSSRRAFRGNGTAAPRPR